MPAVSDRLNDELDCLEDEITQLQADCIDSSAQRRYDTRGRAASSSCTPLVSFAAIRLLEDTIGRLNDVLGMFTEESPFSPDIADMRACLARHRVLFEV
jgi:hypothetical protein